MKSSARVEARIRQLCNLGLGGEAIMPALLRELHALVPSYSNTFFWADENGQLANIYDENPESVTIAPLYIAEFYNRREREVHTGFSHSMHYEHGVVHRDQVITVDLATFHRSDLYNLIFRPLCYDAFLRLVVRDGARPLGALQLWRSPGDPPFTPEEVACLARLVPFFAHALIRGPDLEAPLVDSGESGLLIADTAGRIVFLSRQARRLLYLATHPRTAPGPAIPAPVCLPPEARRLCRLLVSANGGGQAKSPPIWRQRNRWGRFVFKGYLLEAATTGGACVGIVVSREEALPVRLVCAMRNLPLSPRQSEVCLWMASGLDYAAIARRLGISRHTVIAHARWIYSKLDVHDRNSLVRHLLGRQQHEA